MRLFHISHATLLACLFAGAAGAGSPVISSAERSDAIELITREALFGNPERGNVRISPDGKHLSWVAPVDGVLNVWVAPANEPGRAHAVTRDKGRGIRRYFWSHKADTLLYLRDSGGDEDFHLFSLDLVSEKAIDLTPFPKTTAKVISVSHVHPDSILVGMNDRDARWHDLYRVDLASGRRTLLQKNEQQIADYLADDEFNLRYATRSRSDGGQVILQSDGKNKWKPYDEIPFEDFLSTQPLGLNGGGNILYMVDSRGRDTAALYAIDTRSGRKKPLLEDPRADLGGASPSGTHFRVADDPSDRSIDALVHPKTGVVQAVAVNYLRREWSPLDPAVAADLEKLESLGSGEFDVTARTYDDRVWIVAYSAAEAPVIYYRYDRSGGGRITKLFSARPALEGKPLVPQWPQEIRSRDGLTLISYLTLPKNADADGDGKADIAVPMVLLVHGGPTARDNYGYQDTVQWLANRGYAVLQVNYRGSTGFGKGFTNAGDGEWAGKMHDDLLDAMQWAVQEGVTTPEQVAIMGRSYGGYATLVGLSFTPDTFKCGVDIVGPSNLNTLLSTVPPYWASFYEQIIRRMGDPRTEEGRRWLLERSPLTHADKISKPLLIGQGANDPRVKQAEADQIVGAMKARNIPVTYVLFPDEGHGFARPQNSKAFNAVAEGFLGQCLGGRVEPISEDFEGSSISVPVGADRVPGLAEALGTHQQDIRQ